MIGSHCEFGEDIEPLFSENLMFYASVMINTSEHIQVWDPGSDWRNY